MALESIRWQTRPFDEVVVIADQASIDGSCGHALMLCDKYKFKYLETNDSGIGAMKDLGVNATSGDVWCFLGGDDFYHPRFLETTLSIPRDHTFSFTNWRYIDPKGDLGEESPIMQKNMITDQGAFRKACWAMYNGQAAYSVNNSTIAVDRIILDGVSFDPSIKAAEDMVFLLESLPFTKTYHYFPDVLEYARTWYQGGASGTPDRDARVWLDRAKRAISDFYTKRESPTFIRSVGVP
jgi:glycosyltransferase involved in cell wall biosynthesis